jgi:protein-S-isoprenylcysteine O-methyltransferase Ste14
MTGNLDHAEVKTPAPILLLIHLIVAFLLKWTIPMETPAPQAVKITGLAILLAGFLFALAGLFELLKAGTTYSPHQPVSKVVIGGAFRFSRNPIYVGYACTLIGLPLALGNYWGVILSPAMIHFFSLLIIKPEEAYLEKKFGETYAGYRSRVRRWL